MNAKEYRIMASLFQRLSEEIGTDNTIAFVRKTEDA